MSTHADQDKALRPLLALNFFMADMQAGIGPFLGVFLLAHGWQIVRMHQIAVKDVIPYMILGMVSQHVLTGGTLIKDRSVFGQDTAFLCSR